MAWIEAHQELARHPKVRTVARTLGVPRPQVIGHLLCLWWWTLDVAPDGHLECHPADLAEEAQWDGDPDQFIDALVDARLLHRTDSGWEINDWDRYAGAYARHRTGRSNDGTFGNHQRWHVNRGIVSTDCEFCDTSGTVPTGDAASPPIAPESPPESPRSGRMNTGDSDTSGTDPNRSDSSPPESHQPTNQPTNHDTHPLGTQQDAAELLASVWTGNRTPNRKTIAIARRVITECPELDRLTEAQTRQLATWARTVGTRTLGGLTHVAQSWPNWPTGTVRSLPPWCDHPDCDPTSRIRLDETGGRPCPDCSPKTIDEAIA